MKHLVLFTLVVFASTSGSAQWQLIDDFQQWQDGDIINDATSIGWHALSENSTDEYWFLADPYNPENISMYVESIEIWTGLGNTFIQKKLPGDGIFPGETGTLYIECLWSGFDNEWHLGTADKPLEYDPVSGLQTAPGAWDDFNALIRLGPTANIEHRDGDEYISTKPPVILAPSKWYKFWLVVENTWDMNTSPPTSTGILTLYMQGEGNGGFPTLIPVGTDPAKDSASLRRAPVDADGNPQSIIWAMFATNGRLGTMSSGDPFLLDNLYFSPGKNLSNPLSPPCDNCPDENGDLDTGDWMGWINVGHAPHLWLYAIDGWLYMEEPAPDAPGAWGYFFK